MGVSPHCSTRGGLVYRISRCCAVTLVHIWRKKLLWARIFAHRKCGMISLVLLLSRRLNRSIHCAWIPSFSAVSWITRLLHFVKKPVKIVTLRVLSLSISASLVRRGGGPLVQCLRSSESVLHSPPGSGNVLHLVMDISVHSREECQRAKSLWHHVSHDSPWPEEAVVNDEK